MIIAADLSGLISNLLASHQIRTCSSSILHFCSRSDKVGLDKKRHVSSVGPFFLDLKKYIFDFILVKFLS